jgi:hypothetical protein
VRRSLTAPWPSLRQRLGFALLAWLPFVVLIGFAVSQVADDVMRSALSALVLLALVAIPRIAYVAALATLLVLVIGGVFVGAVLLSGALPSVERLTFYVGALLLVGYAATAAVVLVGPRSLRPWSAP